MAYPFQPLNSKKLEELSRIIEETKQKENSHYLQKDYLFPDSIISKTSRPVTDQPCNHLQTDNS